MGIPVLAPDVNQSDVLFSLDTDQSGNPALRYGLSAIKNVGEGAVRGIPEERRKGGPYESIDDFCGRADLLSLNRRALESLIKVGTFDCLGHRPALLGSVEQIISIAQREAHRRAAGQSSMFDVLPATVETGPMTGIVLNGEDSSSKEKIAWEKELLGVPLSENSLKAVAHVDSGGAITSRDQLDVEMEGQRATVLGQLSSVSERTTRDQRAYVITNLELLYGSIEVIAWPDVLEEDQGHLEGREPACRCLAS